MSRGSGEIGGGIHSTGGDHYGDGGVRRDERIFTTHELDRFA